MGSTPGGPCAGCSEPPGRLDALKPLQAYCLSPSKSSRSVLEASKLLVIPIPINIISNHVEIVWFGGSRIGLPGHVGGTRGVARATKNTTGVMFEPFQVVPERPGGLQTTCSSIQRFLEASKPSFCRSNASWRPPNHFLCDSHNTVLQLPVHTAMLLHQMSQPKL